MTLADIREKGEKISVLDAAIEWRRAELEEAIGLVVGPAPSKTVRQRVIDTAAVLRIAIDRHLDGAPSA